MFRMISISSSLLLFATLFYIFSPTIFGLYFFIAILVLLSLLILSVSSMKKHMQYTLSLPVAVTKNAQQDWVIHCTNTSKWFTATAQIYVTWEHTFTKRQYTELLSVTIPAKKTVTKAIQPSHLYSGQYTVQVEKIFLIDALSLFSVKQQSDCKQSTIILPNIGLNHGSRKHEINSNQTPNATVFSQINGDELAHLKLYQPGDSVKQIHWKLSSKLDELYIKQLETTTGQHFVLAVDASQIGANIQLYDKLIEETARQLYSALSTSYSSQLALYENGWHFNEIISEKDVNTALQKLLVQVAPSLTISKEIWQQLLHRHPSALLLTTNDARQHETNVAITGLLHGKDEVTDELAFK